MLLVVGGVWLSGGFADQAAPLPEPRVVTTAQGERMDVRLRDGTAVSLAPNSALIIPEDFARAHRRVSLEGQAFFNVESNPEQPFTIDSPRGSVQVVGTKFVVRDYAETEEPFEVAVDEGIVEARAGAEVQRLESRQFVRLVNEELQFAVIEDPMVHFGWREGNLAFRDAELRHVAATLERWHGLKIVIDGPLKGRRLTAGFAGTPPDDIMSVIALTMNARLERDGDAYRLRAGLNP